MAKKTITLATMPRRTFWMLVRAADLALATALLGDAPNVETLDKNADNYDKDAHKTYNAAARVGMSIIAGRTISAIVTEAHNRLRDARANRDAAHATMQGNWNCAGIERACVATAQHKEMGTFIADCESLLAIWAEVKAHRDAGKEVATQEAAQA